MDRPKAQDKKKDGPKAQDTIRKDSKHQTTRTTRIDQLLKKLIMSFFLVENFILK